MSTHHAHGAAAPVLPSPEQPTKDKAPAVNAAQGFEVQGNSDSLHFPFTPASGQALRVIEGERKAAVHLCRLQAEQADPNELALIVAALYGTTLREVGDLLRRIWGVA